MAQKYRCDSCKKVLLKNEMIEIVDSKRRLWYRCKNCIKKFGKKPGDYGGYYTYLQFEGATGLEYPKKVISYGPRKKR